MATVIEFAVALVFIGLLAGTIWWDARLYRIPNGLNAAFAGLFVVAVASGQVPMDGLWGHLGAGGIALLAGMGLYFLGWAGGGDAKLLSVLILWSGWSLDPLRLILVMALAGGLVSAVVWGAAQWRARGGNRDPDTGPAKLKVPYGVALAVAGFDFWLRNLFPLLIS